MADNTEELALDLPAFLSSMRLNPEADSLRPLVSENLTEILDDETEEERFASILAAIVYNMGEEGEKFDKQRISDLCAQIDQVVNAQLDEIYHDEHFRSFEGVWRGIDDFYNSVNFSADMDVGLLDVTKEEAFEDLEVNSADIAGSELFKKIYVAEYDQYGGQPWGSVVGLFEFDNTPDDLTWLRNMGKVSTVSHAPFVGSVSPKFFGCQNMEEFNALRDIEGLLNSPRYARWNALRETEQAAYLGLTLPRYMARMPYSDETNPADGISYNEKVGIEDSSYLWAPCSLLFARNMARSFESSGWCQHLRGPKGGGLVERLPGHSLDYRGESVFKTPVEITLPDYKEFALANSGFIPLIQEKGSNTATFFSAQSIKRPYFDFKDPKDNENSQLVTNLSYTFSITRIAHYLKCIMRDNIGSSADAPYIEKQITDWVSKYVTTIVNPDDLTLRYYPFKAYSLNVAPVEGRVGWYHCSLNVLPHVQFEGMDVDLRIDARLG